MKQIAPSMKVPPHNLEAETVILSGMAISPKARIACKDSLSGDDFYREAHQHIFQAICELEQPDLITISNYLKKQDLLEKSGGMEHIEQVIAYASTGAGCEYHIKIVKDLSRRRQMILCCSMIAETCFQDWQETDEILSKARKTFNEIDIEDSIYYRKGVDLSNVYTAEEMFNQYGKYIEGLKDNRFLTGIHEIDKSIRGVAGGEVFFIIARAGTYKTALLQNLLRRYVNNSAWGAVFFSLEMPIANIAERYLQMTHEMKGREVEEDFKENPEGLKNKFVRSLNRLFVVPSIVNIKDIVQYIRLIEQNHKVKVGVIGIDYLGLMEGDGKGEYEIISNLAKNIKSLAKLLNIPVLVISQTSRKGGTGETEINLDMGRGSGVVEEAADFLFGIFKDEDKIICKILKNRKGRVGACWEIQFDPKTFILGEECKKWEAPKKEKGMKK